MQATSDTLWTCDELLLSVEVEAICCCAPADSSPCTFVNATCSSKDCCTRCFDEHDCTGVNTMSKDNSLCTILHSTITLHSNLSTHSHFHPTLTLLILTFHPSPPLSHSSPTFIPHPQSPTPHPSPTFLTNAPMSPEHNQLSSFLQHLLDLC